MENYLRLLNRRENYTNCFSKLIANEIQCSAVFLYGGHRLRTWRTCHDGAGNTISSA